MTRRQIETMLRDILGWVDYDIAKEYDAETAEEPEYAEERMQSLVAIAERHIAKANKPKKTKKPK